MDIEARLEKLEKQYNQLLFSDNIPLNFQDSLSGRGFSMLHTIFGKTTLSGAGVAFIRMPSTVTKQSIAVASYQDPAEGALGASLLTGYQNNNYGGSSSRFDITDLGSNIFRYTWDGTGTNPNINSTTLPIGSRLQIFSSNFNSANQNAASRPFFIVQGSGANYFQIENFTPGVAENDKTLGSGGSITGGPLDKNILELYIFGNPTQEVNYGVFSNPNIYRNDV